MIKGRRGIRMLETVGGCSTYCGICSTHGSYLRRYEDTDDYALTAGAALWHRNGAWLTVRVGLLLCSHPVLQEAQSCRS